MIDIQTISSSTVALKKLPNKEETCDYQTSHNVSIFSVKLQIN